MDGSYSCLRGDDDRRRVLKPCNVGVKLGVVEAFSVTGVAGLDDRCGGTGGGLSSFCGTGTSSLTDSGIFFCSFDGAVDGIFFVVISGAESARVSLTGVLG